MNKRQALKIGRRVCYHYKSGGNWVTVAPWKTENPDGPKTEGQTSYYRDALRMTAANVAVVALYQYCDARDIPTECITEGYGTIWREREDLCNPGTARRFLNVGIAAIHVWLALVNAPDEVGP